MTRDQLTRRIQDLAREVYSANTVTPEEAIEYDELTKFPELKKVITFLNRLIGLLLVLLHFVLI
jgi:hypothetical protein